MRGPRDGSSVGGPSRPGSGPAGGARSRTRVGVLVVGDRSKALGIARHLPPGWAARRSATLPRRTDAELLVLCDATGPAVAAARRRHGTSALLAVVAVDAPGEVIGEVLEAGADACVRDGSTASVVGHLRHLLAAGRTAAPTAAP